MNMEGSHQLPSNPPKKKHSSRARLDPPAKKDGNHQRKTDSPR